MKKLISVIAATAATAVSLCACSGNGGEAPSVSGKSDPFAYDNDMISPAVVLDGRDDDELWKSDGVVKLRFSSCDVSLVKNDTALYFLFKVFDITPYRYVNEGAADEVTCSDSIEIYIDSLLGRAAVPQAGCYQVNLGRDGRTRIMSGGSGVWLDWAGMYMFEVREGFNDEYDYYFVEVMIPTAQLGSSVTGDMGITFGHVDRTVDENKDLENYYTWTGITYNGVFTDPQDPSKYLVLTADGKRILSYEEYLASKTQEQSRSDVKEQI